MQSRRSACQPQSVGKRVENRYGGGGQRLYAVRKDRLCSSSEVDTAY